MNVKLKYLIFFLSLSAFVALCVYLEMNDTLERDVTIQVVQRSGHSLIDVAQIKSLAEESTKDISADTMSKRLFSVEKKILQNPYVEKSIVYQKPSGQIQIQLWEQIPVYRVVGDTVDYYVSQTFDRLPLKKGTKVDVPLVSGANIGASEQDICKVLNAINDDAFFRDIFVSLDVSRYRKGASFGYCFTAHTRLGNIDVVLGDSSDLKEKIENFKILYSYLSKDDKINDYKVVNLEFLNYLVCQRKK